MKFFGKAKRGKNSIFYTLRSDISFGGYGKVIKYCGFTPDGTWAWGYSGKAPLETAEVMLAWLSYKRILEEPYYPYSAPFMREVIAKLPDNWELTDKEILKWIENYKKKAKA